MVPMNESIDVVAERVNHNVLTIVGLVQTQTGPTSVKEREAMEKEMQLRTKALITDGVALLARMVRALETMADPES